MQPYESQLYGEVSAVTFAHTTLEKERPGRITWLYNANQVFSAEEQDGTVVKELMMRLQLSNVQVVQALWVFDSFVVVRLTNSQIQFFEKPLIQGGTESPMPVTYNSIVIPQGFGTFEFGRDETNSTRCYLFGVS